MPKLGNILRNLINLKLIRINKSSKECYSSQFYGAFSYFWYFNFRFLFSLLPGFLFDAKDKLKMNNLTTLLLIIDNLPIK